MTQTHHSINLTEEQRAAAEHLRDSDNPLAPLAELLCHLDDGVSIEQKDD